MKRWLLALFFFLTASVAFAAQQTPAAVNGCIYNSSLPTLVAGQSVVFSCGPSGELIIATNPANPLSVAGGASSNYAPSQVSVAATATSLIAARSGGRNAVIITNMSTTPVFLGGSGVTAATGGYLAGIVGAAKVLPYNGAIYGITATGTASVSVEEIY